MVRNLVRQLQSADEAFVSDGVSSHAIDISYNRANNEVQVRANDAGLIHFGLSILRLVGRPDGSHHVFDEAELVDRCDAPIVVAKYAADWDSE
jgi:hypothetical protein